jgi:hypothetical protein
MASWKQLTLDDGGSVYVNMENISHMWKDAQDRLTTIFLLRDTATLRVTETPDQILIKQSVQSSH